MRRGLALLAALLAGAGGAEGQEIRIGMRADAKPFVYEAAPGVFEGFLADICRGAVAAAGYSEVVEERIDARTRLGNPAQVGEGIDVVCDPTTLTLERAGRFDFSPIVFIANATFVTRDARVFLTPEQAAASEACVEAVAAGARVAAAGMLAGSTAIAAFDLARARGFLGDPSEHEVCAITVESHLEGIDRLCGGDLSFYFGDADILRAFLQDRAGCRVTFNTSFLTYEPYALVVHRDDEDFRRRFIQAVYGLFADGSVEGFYTEHFGNRRKSDALSMLFGINSVPRGTVSAD